MPGLFGDSGPDITKVGDPDDVKILNKENVFAWEDMLFGRNESKGKGLLSGAQANLASYSPENFMSRLMGMMPQMNQAAGAMTEGPWKEMLGGAKAQAQEQMQAGMGALSGQNSLFSPAAMGGMMQKAVGTPFAQAGAQMAGQRLGAQTGFGQQLMRGFGNIYGTGQQQAGQNLSQIQGLTAQASQREYWQPTYMTDEGGGSLGGGLAGAAAGGAAGAAGGVPGAALGAGLGFFAGLF